MTYRFCIRPMGGGINVNTVDVLTFVPRLNSQADGSGAGGVSPNLGDERWDINQDGIISMTDVLDYYVSALGRICATMPPAPIPPFSQQ